MNTLAVVAFVLSLLCFTLISLILGIVSLDQIKRTGERGRGLAVAAVAISATVMLAVGGLIATAIFAAAGDQAERDPQGQITEAGSIDVDDLLVGDCLEAPPEDGEPVRELRAVPCAQPHRSEVFALIDLPDGPYPGRIAITNLAHDGCPERLDLYAPQAAPGIEVSYVFPTSDGWDEGRHAITCLAEHPAEVTGSLRGT